MAKHLVKEGRQFQPSEWLEFECDPAKPSRELRQVARDFTKRVVNLTDDWLVANGHRDLIGTYDEDTLAFDAYASIVGHGVGLWEQDGGTGLPPDVEGALDKVVKADVIASRMAHHISDECSSEREEVESHQKRVRSKPRHELNEQDEEKLARELDPIEEKLRKAKSVGAPKGATFAAGRKAAREASKAIDKFVRAHPYDLDLTVGARHNLRDALGFLHASLAKTKRAMKEAILSNDRNANPTGSHEELFQVLAEWAYEMVEAVRDMLRKKAERMVIARYPDGWYVVTGGPNDKLKVFHNDDLIDDAHWSWPDVETVLRQHGVDTTKPLAKSGTFNVSGPPAQRVGELLGGAAMQPVSLKTAVSVARQLGIDPATKPAGWLTQFAHGLSVELEHADITGGDLRLTGRIVLAHLDEAPDYYERLATLGLDEVGEIAAGEKLPGDVGAIDDEMQIMDTAAVTGSVPSYLYSIHALRSLERRGMLAAPRVVGDFHVFSITPAGRSAFARGRLREVGAKELHAADFRSVGDALEQAEQLFDAHHYTQRGAIGPEGTRRTQTSAYAGVPGFMKRYDLVEARGLYHWPKEGVDVGYLPADAMQISKLRGGWFERARARAAKDNPVGSDDGVPWVQITRDPERYKAAMAATAKLGPIDQPAKVYELLGTALAKEDQEVFVVVLLDIRGQCRGVAEVHRGGRSRVPVSSADVMRVVLVSGAEGFTIVHNHPTGKADPSPADQDLTRAIRKAAELHPDVTFVDHVIIGSGEYYTFTGKKLVKATEAPKRARKRKKGK